jgi:hypothetical protein
MYQADPDRERPAWWVLSFAMSPSVSTGVGSLIDFAVA